MIICMVVGGIAGLFLSGGNIVGLILGACVGVSFRKWLARTLWM